MSHDSPSITKETDDKKAFTYLTTFTRHFASNGFISENLLTLENVMQKNTYIFFAKKTCKEVLWRVANQDF